MEVGNIRAPRRDLAPPDDKLPMGKANPKGGKRMPSRIESFDGANDIEALSDHLATMSQIIDQARLEITGELEAATHDASDFGLRGRPCHKPFSIEGEAGCLP